MLKEKYPIRRFYDVGTLVLPVASLPPLAGYAYSYTLRKNVWYIACFQKK
jgi:hypothetical protein